MGANYKTVGGGPATGLAENFVNFLQQGITTGSFGGVTPGQQYMGTSPVQSTTGIAGVLNDLLSGGAGQIGGSINEMINRNISDQALALRARFGASGGNAFSTGAAAAETAVRAEAAPQMIQATGGLQLQALAQLLPLFANITQMGIPQAQTVGQENPFVSGLKIAGQFAPLALPFIAPAATPLLAGMSALGGGASAAPSLIPSSISYRTPVMQPIRI